MKCSTCDDSAVIKYEDVDGVIILGCINVVYLLAKSTSYVIIDSSSIMGEML